MKKLSVKWGQSLCSLDFIFCEDLWTTLTECSKLIETNCERGVQGIVSTPELIGKETLSGGLLIHL
jgi:hypothetical protein